MGGYYAGTRSFKNVRITDRESFESSVKIAKTEKNSGVIVFFFFLWILKHWNVFVKPRGKQHTGEGVRNVWSNTFVKRKIQHLTIVTFFLNRYLLSVYTRTPIVTDSNLKFLFVTTPDKLHDSWYMSWEFPCTYVYIKHPAYLV